MASRKPNVLIFMLDTQRSMNLSCYGYDKPTSPNIDRLAGEGAVFLDNVSPAVWTLPAVASLMTGLHVHSHGAGAHNESFGGQFRTMADCFNDLGYRTVAFFGNQYAAMSRKGFRETSLIAGNPNYIGGDCFEVSRARVESVKRWIDANREMSGPPFFAYAQIMDPHMPLHPRSPFKERFVHPVATDEEMKAAPQDIMNVYVGKRRLSERDREVLLAMYDAETAAADSHVGALMDHLRETGVLDDTIVFVMSDHGEMYAEKPSLAGQHMTHHLCCYEELIRVPLVVRHPEWFAGGKRVASPTQTHDIFPTLAEICGFEAPHCQGFSLLPALEDKPGRSWTITEYMKSIHIAARVMAIDPTLDQRLFVRWTKALRKDGMKYIWTSDLRDELFDLRNDPLETRNLIGDDPVKAEEMRLELERRMMRFPPADRGDYLKGQETKPELLDKLEAMDWFLDRPGCEPSMI